MPMQVAYLSKDFVNGFELTTTQLVFEVDPNVAGRDAPGFIGGQDFLLVFFRNLFPEFLIEKLGVGLHREAGAGHHLFLRAQNLAQGFNFGIHAIEKLFYGIDAKFAAFIAVESEANGHVFGELEQHGLVWRLRRRLGGQTSQGLLQGDLGPHGHGAEPGLEGGRVHARIGVFARFSQAAKTS